MGASTQRRDNRKKQFAKPVEFRGQKVYTPKKPSPFLLQGMLARIMASMPSISNHTPRPPSPKIDEVLSICPGGNHAWVMVSTGRMRTGPGRLRKPLTSIPSKLLARYNSFQELLKNRQGEQA